MEAVAEVEVEDLAVVGTEMVEIGTEVVEATDMEVVEEEDMTEIGTEVEDMVEAVEEVLTGEAMAGAGIDHTDHRDNPRWRKNYTATHSALFLFSCNVNTTYRCV